MTDGREWTADVGVTPALTAEQRRKAAVVTASYATAIEDLRTLLEMLGLSAANDGGGHDDIDMPSTTAHNGLPAADMAALAALWEQTERHDRSADRRRWEAIRHGLSSG